MTENLKNHTLFRGTYLYTPYMGVSPWGIDVIRYEPHTLFLKPFKFFSLTASTIEYIFTVAKLFDQVI